MHYTDWWDEALILSAKQTAAPEFCGCTWAAEEEKCLCKKFQEKQALFPSSLPLKSCRAAVQKPVTFASAMLITTWAIMHSKTHHRDQWKKDCCWLSNGDSSHSQDRRDWQRDISHRRQDEIYSQKDNFQLMCPSFFLHLQLCVCVCL